MRHWYSRIWSDEDEAYVSQSLAEVINEWNDNNARAAQAASIFAGLARLFQLALLDVTTYLEVSPLALMGVTAAYLMLFIGLPLWVGIRTYQDPDNSTDKPQHVSASYKSLFVARQFTLLLAATLVHFLGTVWLLASDEMPFVGPQETASFSPTLMLFKSTLFLLFVQSMWWPFILFSWAILNTFSHHWLYFQKDLDVFNGDLKKNALYIRVLMSALLFSCLFLAKRYSIRFYLDQWAYRLNAEKLAEVMQNILWIIRLGELNQATINAHTYTNTYLGEIKELFEKINRSTHFEQQQFAVSTYSTRLFRRASHLMLEGVSMKSAADIYQGLFGTATNVSYLGFFEAVALNEGNEKNKTIARQIIKLFRPHSDGVIPWKNFDRGITTASDENESLTKTISTVAKLGFAFEELSNYVFWAPIIVGLLCLLVLYLLQTHPSFDAVSLGLSIIFAAVFGFVRLVYHDGVFYIVRDRRFDIDDLVELDLPDTAVSMDEFSTLRIKEITLSHTHFVNIFSNDWSSVSNKDLEKRNVRNWSRLASVFRVTLSFPVNTWDDGIVEAFHEEIKRFASASPSEWFAADTSILAKTRDGHSTYAVVIPHRLPWKEYTLVLQSKTTLMGFCDKVLCDRIIATAYPAPNGAPNFPDFKISVD